MLFLRNLRFALRVLRRNSPFAASAIGVMALGIGASTAVMRQGAVWICAGLLAGIAGARLLTGYVSGLLFRVTPTDVMTFVAVAAGLAAMAALATTIPALRASRIDPMLSLRAE